MKRLIGLMILLSVSNAFAGVTLAECQDRKLDQESVFIQERMKIIDQILFLQEKLELASQTEDRLKIYDQISIQYDLEIEIMNKIISLKETICE